MIEVEIDSLSNEGKGVGRVDAWVVFVAFALPGERVRARVFRNHKNYSEADLLEVLVPSPDRREPLCPLFGECGGCQYQNLSEAAQHEWKRRQVEELLRRLAGVEAKVEPVIASPLAYGYRSKITPHFQKPRDGKIEGIGFLRAGSRHTIVDVPRCPIAVEAINDRYAGLREEVRSKAATYKKGATLLLRAGLDGVVTEAGASVREPVGGIEFRFPAGDFFQNNPFILESFTGYVAGEAADEGIPFLVDAYCGSGLFALTAASRFEQVLGIEISENAIAAAGANAEANRIQNARFLAGDVDDLFGEVSFPGGETAVIIDPPRKGCSGSFVEQLLAFGPRRVVYVSCNPATQMRDLALFDQAGYGVVRVQPFDLFPQTKHLECVMTLVR